MPRRLRAQCKRSREAMICKGFPNEIKQLSLPP